MLGYRSWRIDSQGLLHSPIAAYIWTAGSNVAECQRGIGQSLMAPPDITKVSVGPCPDPPNVDCKCGFYAYQTLEMATAKAATNNASNVMGLVQTYGRVIEHTDGTLRAQVMAIIALLIVRNLDSENDDPYHISYWPGPKRVTLDPEILQRAGELLSIPTHVVETANAGKLWLATQEAVYLSRYDLQEPEEY